jgi:hypothetical protein
MFRSFEVNKRTEVGGLDKRCRGKGLGEVRMEAKVTMDTRTAVRVRMRAKVRIEVKWVLSICLVEINK